MNVTLLSIAPTPAARAARRPELTPELLSAVMARYSRNNEGLAVILAKVQEMISKHGEEKAVDAVFRFVDFGHASIADMTPVGMVLDGITIWMAYLVWSLCPTRVDLPIIGDDLDFGEDEMLGGQESSTRYIKMSIDGLPQPSDLGIPITAGRVWKERMEELFRAYNKASAYWDQKAQANPSVMRIPTALLNDPSEKAFKQVERMRRNYVFDRSRYFIPIAAKTNMAMVMPARTWAALCQYLLSSPLEEAVKLGGLIRSELALASPNLVRHAGPTEYAKQAILDEFDEHVTAAHLAKMDPEKFSEAPCVESLSVFLPPEDLDWNTQMAQGLKNHRNRYAPFGRAVRRTGVRFGWSAVALAEIRDLNRHRTGTKDAPPIPQGFYCAGDQTDESDKLSSDVGCLSSLLGVGFLLNNRPEYVYWLPLGVQFPFEHLTTADKFIYEAELRTGVGAHYRYADHLHKVLELWYQKFPATRGLIQEGAAEPE